MSNSQKPAVATVSYTVHQRNADGVDTYPNVESREEATGVTVWGNGLTKAQWNKVVSEAVEVYHDFHEYQRDDAERRFLMLRNREKNFAEEVAKYRTASDDSKNDLPF